MIVTNQKIIDALVTLKTVCSEKSNDCDICPLGTSEGACKLSSRIPDEWEINTQADIWRAIKD